LNKVNDDLFKDDQQWIEISTSKAKKETNQQKNKLNKSKNISNVIDTFTNNYVKSEAQNTYRVQGDIGTLIAHKIFKGEEIHVCKNGEPVKSNDNLFIDDDFTFNDNKKKKFVLLHDSLFKFSSISKLIKTFRV
jgi:hypothetical protein